MIAAPPAHAAFPGANGKIAYQGTGPDIHVMNPDGSNDQDLGSGQTPSWSPDGTKIAFADGGGLWVMNADGSLRHEIVGSNSDGSVVGITIDGPESHPSWSPDGTKIAFARWNCTTDPTLFCTSILETINADDTGETKIVSSHNPNPLDPSWSPDGTKIAFAGYGYATNYCCGDIYTINPDGTGLTQLTNTPDADDNSIDWSPDGFKLLADSDTGTYTMNMDGTGVSTIRPSGSGSPAWSPDRGQIVFGNAQICTMNADGTNVTCLATQGRVPDWQPIPYTGYPRPRGASPFRTYLVPAYKQCDPPGNSAHGAPLSFPSCNPPQQTSSYLTVGTPDSNGRAAGTIGSVRYTAVVGSPTRPADMKIDVSITGVLSKATLTPYSGELLSDVEVRITDKNNTPSPGAATIVDIPFPVDVPCAGALCAVSTSANAVIPGAITAGQRAIWELGQVQVYDGGATGVAGSSDATLFMDQGIFTP